MVMQEPCTGEDGAGKEDGVVPKLAALEPQDQPRCSHQRRGHDQQRHPGRKRAPARAHDEERRCHRAGKAALHRGRQHTCQPRCAPQTRCVSISMVEECYALRESQLMLMAWRVP